MKEVPGTRTPYSSKHSIAALVMFLIENTFPCVSSFLMCAFSRLGHTSLSLENIVGTEYKACLYRLSEHIVNLRRVTLYLQYLDWGCWR